MVDKNSGVDIGKLETVGSKPGVIIEFSGGVQGQPKKITPNQYPQAHSIEADKNKRDLNEISGINEFMKGNTSKDTSGIAMYRGQQQGATISRPIFKNYYLTIRGFGTTLTELIRHSKVYSFREIMEILDEQGEHINPAEILAKMKQFKAGFYQTTVGTSNHAPSLRMAHFDELMRMAQNGLPIPSDIIMKYTDISDKETIMKRLQQQEQMKSQMEMARFQMEQMLAQQGKGKGSSAAPKGTPSPAKSSGNNMAKVTM